MPDVITQDSLNEFMNQLIGNYPFLSRGLAILLPFLEAFMPFLPVTVLATVNAAVFGLWEGFLYSWLGSVVGSYALFMFVRFLGRFQFLAFLHKRPRIESSLKWIEKQGFGPLFIMYCIPFVPSSLINVVAGLSSINNFYFLLALSLGKSVMLLTMSYIGADLMSFVEHPLKLVVVVAATVVVWIVGKKLEKRMHHHEL